MHGIEEKSADLMSDLPQLLMDYKPGMRIQTVVSYSDEDLGNIMTGVRVSHSPKEEDEEVMHGLTIGQTEQG